MTVEPMNLKPGDRIRLIAMPEDPCPVEPGTTGTVKRIATFTDCAWSQVYVAWDKPRSLMLCIPPDVVEVISKGEQV